MNRIFCICSLSTSHVNTHHSSKEQSEKNRHNLQKKKRVQNYSCKNGSTLCLPNSLIAGHLIKRSCANLSDTINPISNVQQLVHFHNDKGIIHNPLLVPVSAIILTLKSCFSLFFKQKCTWFLFDSHSISKIDNCL